jgi:hypothetical protein
VSLHRPQSSRSSTMSTIALRCTGPRVSELSRGSAVGSGKMRQQLELPGQRTQRCEALDDPVGGVDAELGEQEVGTLGERRAGHLCCIMMVLLVIVSECYNINPGVSR